MRLRIDLAYDGTDFHGWATQPTLRTVQGELEAALATVVRSPERPAVVVAGRTDAGVHARGQVVHVDLDDDLVARSAGRGVDDPVPALTRRLNGVLPGDVRVHRTRVAPEGFDARFSALWRRYAYRVADRAGLADPLTRRHVLAWGQPVDEEAMNAAAAPLVGVQDFAAFCKKRPGATTIRTLLELSWARDHDGVLVGTVVADAFCHNMVRALVGCLLTVGEGRRPASWAHDVLVGGRRDPAVTVVHPHGLVLEEVGYPDDTELAQRAEQTRNRRTRD
ncbi:tRNA pseudouridine(38-40) synthase TruA [Nocardioides sp. ChNu-153]|uniref:tRNA pseudouridine(38-40) synthase TruA n=1 Tax=unclassified Nocardioides TaxID=2615069 RepID=UPI002406A8D1|nr:MULTISPECIES: tRNA pseudouridine(38-40) synthase TruA [unclassified Nocardioides]MDF9717842.1 tRNA pseudouridine(38-40) synthase TruA [Nocardioides sp. ChNu-99]MDN7121422.1 tRNA pseudouridine(38-40) synthase TruA [Nocardioides sp. ChNu-153]